MFAFNDVRLREITNVYILQISVISLRLPLMPAPENDCSVWEVGSSFHVTEENEKH